MPTPPTFTAGQVLTAAHMNAVGLWEIKSETVGTGVATVTISNAFTTDYDNYRVVVGNIDCSAAGIMRITLGGIGGTAYYGARLTLNTAGVSTGTGNNGLAYWEFSSLGTSNDTGLAFDVINPMVAQRKQIFGFFSTNTGDNGFYSGSMVNTSQLSSITFTTSAGTMTGGTIRVYGYRN